jgi:hypothetical protein
MQRAHLFLSLQMFVEVKKLFAQLRDYRYFVQKDLVQVFNVFFNVTSVLFNNDEKTHPVFENRNHFVNVLSVMSYLIFFFF